MLNNETLSDVMIFQFPFASTEIQVMYLMSALVPHLQQSILKMFKPEGVKQTSFFFFQKVKM